jgi:hypothetical protein
VADIDEVLETIRAFEEWREEHALSGEEAVEQYRAHLEVQEYKKTIDTVRDVLDGDEDSAAALELIRQAVSRVS